jgi:hypothetical protein
MAASAWRTRLAHAGPPPGSAPAETLCGAGSMDSGVPDHAAFANSWRAVASTRDSSRSGSSSGLPLKCRTVLEPRRSTAPAAR